MADAEVRTEQEPQQIPKLSRRGFLGWAAKLGIGVVAAGIPSRPAEAGAPEPPARHPASFPGTSTREMPVRMADKGFNWDELRRLLVEAPSDRGSSGLKAIVGKWVDELEKSYEPRLKRTQELIDLTRQTDEWGRPRPSQLVQEIEIFLGRIDRSIVNAEKILPFYQERLGMLNNLNVIKGSIIGMQVKGREPLQDQYFYLQQFIQSAWKTHQDNFSFSNDGLENEEFPQDPPIVMDSAIAWTEEGKRIFESHKQKIEQFIHAFPYFRGLSTRIILSSRKYGDKFTANPDGGSSTYSSERNLPVNRIIGVVRINMDSLSDLTVGADFGSPEQTFAHESYGHGLDPLVSKDFTEHLSPKELIERYTHYFQILNNTDWADHDGSIKDLFRPVRSFFEDLNMMRSNRKITTSEFVDIIRQYPRNYILFNAQGRRASIFDDVMGIPPEPSPPPNQQRPVAKDLLNYDDFMARYLPVLREQVKGIYTNDLKAVKAQIILYGLGKYRDEFKNTEGLWHYYQTGNNNVVPFGERDTYDTWVDYLNTIVLNATIYDGFINGDPFFQGWSRENKEKFSRHVIDLRKRARYELFAEGVAWAHVFGNRVPDEPQNPQKRLPYRLYLEHTANLLLRRMQQRKSGTLNSVNTSLSNHY